MRELNTPSDMGAYSRSTSQAAVAPRGRWSLIMTYLAGRRRVVPQVSASLPATASHARA